MSNLARLAGLGLIAALWFGCSPDETPRDLGTTPKDQGLESLPEWSVPSCTDKRQNGGETGVDCGGAICPKCGKAMPLFNTTLGVGQEDGLPPAAEEEEIWDTVEDFQETPAPAPDDNDVVGRIALKQVPADQLQPPQKTMMGQGAPSQPGLSSLATTDDDGQLIPDVIHAGDGAQAAPTPSNGGQAPGGGSFLDSGFDLGPENPEMEGASGVRNMSGLDSGAPPPPAGGMPNLLDELDAELDNALPEDEEEIPEAEPLIEMDHEVEDFFESEQTPGLVLPDDGAIAVSIP